MLPVTDLVNGFEILKPFLTSYGFTFDSYENGKSSGGHFTAATFLKGNKKFIIGYRFSIGYVVYQCEHSQVGHEFYVDGLGYSKEKQFPDFQSGDKLLPFRHILHDFNFLIQDFFAGDCIRLKALAVEQANQLEELRQKAFEDGKYENDRMKVQKARNAFKSKHYRECLEIYASIEHVSVLSELDKKMISYCRSSI